LIVAECFLIAADNDEEQDEGRKKVYFRHSQEIDSKGRETRALLEENTFRKKVKLKNIRP
jgi:hypothetical protein